MRCLGNVTGHFHRVRNLSMSEEGPGVPARALCTHCCPPDLLASPCPVPVGSTSRGTSSVPSLDKDLRVGFFPGSGRNLAGSLHPASQGLPSPSLCEPTEAASPLPLHSREPQQMPQSGPFIPATCGLSWKPFPSLISQPASEGPFPAPTAPPLAPGGALTMAPHSRPCLWP